MNAFTELAARQISAPVKARQRAAEKRAARKQETDAERSTMLRVWKSWRRERLEALLAGTHGAAVGALTEFIDHMTLADSAKLLAIVQQGPWRAADEDTRFEILSLVNAAIVRLREQHGLPPLDDPLFDQPPNVFLVLREWLR